MRSKCGQGGEGQKTRNFCRHHIWKLPNDKKYHLRIAQCGFQIGADHGGPRNEWTNVSVGFHSSKYVEKIWLRAKGATAAMDGLLKEGRNHAHKTHWNNVPQKLWFRGTFQLPKGPFREIWLGRSLDTIPHFTIPRPPNGVSSSPNVHRGKWTKHECN